MKSVGTATTRNRSLTTPCDGDFYDYLLDKKGFASTDQDNLLILNPACELRPIGYWPWPVGASGFYQSHSGALPVVVQAVLASR